MTLSSIRIAVLTVRSRRSSSRVPPSTWRARLIEPRLQTAVSSAEVLRVISVQRFELWITPQWSCGERMLQGSLNVIQGWPVSNSMVSILRHRLLALIVFAMRILPARACLS